MRTLALVLSLLATASLVPAPAAAECIADVACAGVGTCHGDWTLLEVTAPEVLVRYCVNHPADWPGECIYEYRIEVAGLVDEGLMVC